MKIRFSIITPDILAQVRPEVDMLLRAVTAGDLDGMDSVTARLLALTANCQSVDLSEEQWRGFLDGIRSENPAFQSNYLLPGLSCASILPTVTANDYVLELPIDGDPGNKDSYV